MVGKLFEFSPIQADDKKEVNTPNRRNTVWNIESILQREPIRNTKWWQFSYIPLFLIMILLFLIVLLPLLDQVDLKIQYLLNKQLLISHDKCSFEIVESIPEGLVYPKDSKQFPSTFETWKKLIQLAEHSIEIGSFYWSLRKSNDFPSESEQGDIIFNDLLNAGLNRNITIRIAQSAPTKSFESNETMYLMEKKAASVKFLDFDRLLGSGVLHTKFWIIDRKHFYVGSANLDWRALTQVKELGIAFYNCSSLAEDLAKIFDVYWTVGNQTKLPDKWPNELSTYYNSQNPFVLDLNGNETSLFISSSPPQFSPHGRNDDLAALLHVINTAQKYVHISVMEYLPLVVFSKHIKYWPVIDDALRTVVVEKNIQVRLLISEWRQTKPMMLNFLRSLLAINKFKKRATLEVKMFRVPSDSTQSKIPFARVNHNKYLVTDNGAFIGTSNWSGDYFLSTAGVSIVSTSSNGTSNVIQKQLESVFERDWNSTYAEPLEL